MIRSLASLSILASSLVFAAPNGSATESAMLQRLSQQFSDACAAGDAKTVDKLLDEDVVFMNETGQVAGKADLVKGMSPPPSFLKRTLTQSDFAVVLQGSVAVTRFTDNATTEIHGATLHATYKSTETWMKKKGAWKMIQSQTLTMQDEPAAVQLPVATLDEYVGHYLAGKDFTFDIARSGQSLTATSFAGPAAPLKAELRDVLFSPGQPSLRRIFTRDAAGKVNGFISRRDGHDLVFKRVG